MNLLDYRKPPWERMGGRYSRYENPFWWRGLFRVEVLEEGVRIPLWLGVAWWRCDSMRAICYPVPFHWIIGWIAVAWFKLRKPTGWYMTRMP